LSGQRSAPSVSYPVGRCRFWAWLLLGLGGVIGAALAATALLLPPTQAVVLAALLLAWIAWAGWLLRHPPRGLLLWQRTATDAAGHWAWRPVEQGGHGEALGPVYLRLALDLQQRTLLQLRGPRGVPRWLWVEQGSAPADWLALRRALVAHATAP
jgi:hypothetical protein